jgi:hypothetical protein
MTTFLRDAAVRLSPVLASRHGRGSRIRTAYAYSRRWRVV